jgi:hypothetical protein
VRGRTLGLVIAVALVVVAVVLVVSRSSDGSAGSGGSGTDGVSALPLASAVSTSSLASVLIPMGHLDDPANTFWELVVRPAGTTTWLVRTPPGVADNAGLVVAQPAAGPLTAGFLPSQDLTFSPLADSSDQGRTWSQGQLPTALAPAPDALATGPDGVRYALVAEGGRAVWSAASGLSSWVPVVTQRTLALADPACHLSAVTAVAAQTGGRLLVGLSCSRGHRVGVLAGVGSTASSSGAGAWQPVGPSIGGSPGVATTVIRLEDSAAGISGLVGVMSGSTSSLVAFGGSGGAAHWTESAPLGMSSGWSVMATGTGGGSGQGQTVLLGSGAHRKIEEIAGPGQPWTAVPAVPPGTGAVAVVGSQTDAFVASGTNLTVLSLAAGSTRWQRAASLYVPLQYGSSS